MKKKTRQNPSTNSSEAETPQVFAVEIKDGAAKFTRRDFLKAAGAASAATAAAIAACGSELTSTQTPVPTKAPTNSNFRPHQNADPHSYKHPNSPSV
jgi:hypothetical protein